VKIHTTDDLGHPIAQGSAAWFRLRLGIPTCSNMHKLVTPAEFSYPKAACLYAAELVAERYLGVSMDSTENNDYGFMGRGKKYEDEARRWYEYTRDVDVRQVAFVSDDEMTEGGSPDGLVEESEDGPGGVEIKILSARHHVRALLAGEPVTKHLDPQVHGLIRLTGARWWDVVAYHPADPERGIPALPPLMYRVRRNEDRILQIDACMEEFKADMDRAGRALAAVGAGRIDDNDLLQKLLASVAANKGTGEALDLDELAQFTQDVDECARRGILGADDVARIHSDIEKNRWDDVRGMQAYVRRHLMEAV